MWSLINVWSNLHTTDVKLTGLQFCGFFLDPFVNSGVIVAYFHSEGSITSSGDKSNNFASGVLIFSTISLISFGGIPSTLGDLLSLIFLFSLLSFQELQITALNVLISLKFSKWNWKSANILCSTN